MSTNDSVIREGSCGGFLFSHLSGLKYLSPKYSWRKPCLFLILSMNTDNEREFLDYFQEFSIEVVRKVFKGIIDLWLSMFQQGAQLDPLK